MCISLSFFETSRSKSWEAIVIEVLLYLIYNLFYSFSDSAFKQQRLPAWQPILTAGTVLPAFFVIGIAFIPVGISLLYFSDAVREHVIDYTHCNATIGYTGNWVTTNQTCQNIIKENPNQICTCRIDFNLTKDFGVCLIMTNIVCFFPTCYSYF